MGWLAGGWQRILVALMALGLAAVAYIGASGVSNKTMIDAPKVELATAATNISEHPVATSAESAGYLTVNVEMADGGIQPASIYIPAGQRVLLVMRNRGSHEHHFHISGLVPKDMLWLSKETGDVETDDINAPEHSEHNHGGEMVSYHKCSSGSGICPTGDAVHAHANSGDIDAIFFTATNTGTFSARDPLHPEIAGTVIVF